LLPLIPELLIYPARTKHRDGGGGLASGLSTAFLSDQDQQDAQAGPGTLAAMLGEKMFGEKRLRGNRFRANDRCVGPPGLDR
jgi:hypothetical protein